MGLDLIETLNAMDEALVTLRHIFTKTQRLVEK
jgi:hypothetical protein